MAAVEGILNLGPDVVLRNQELNSRSRPAVNVIAAPNPVGDSLGTFRNGATIFVAEIGRESGALSSDGNISVTMVIEAQVSSLSIRTFDEFRATLSGLIGADKVTQIDEAAGIPQGAQDGRGMDRFAKCLFSMMFLQDFASANQDFDAANCVTSEWKCNDILNEIRKLDPDLLYFKGTLHVEGPPDMPQQMDALIPVSTVDFSSGYRVPFSGYSGPITFTGASQATSRAAAPSSAGISAPIKFVLEAGQLLSCLLNPS
jgi:hypothetical protein